MNISREEIRTRNNAIAKLLGWEKEFPDAHYLMEFLDYLRTNIKRSSDVEDWELGQYTIDKFEVGLGKFFVSLYQWTGKNWRRFKQAKNPTETNGIFNWYENTELSIHYQVGSPKCSNHLEMLFLGLSDIALVLNTPYVPEAPKNKKNATNKS